MDLLGRTIGGDQPLFLIAGPCVIEPGERTREIAERLQVIARELDLFLIFKASFDKANRSSGTSYRGPGMERGLAVLETIKADLGLPILTDVHERTPVEEVAAVVDVLQTPAFLVRQTDFLQGVARAGKPVNVKKGQFLSPWDMQQVVAKCREVGNDQVMVCERGASFGYNNLVADMRSLAVMRQTGCPVIFDATHAVQLPGAQGTSSGGQREMVPVLARAAAAAGVAGLFMETHPDPESALSDPATMWPLDRMKEVLEVVVAIDRVAKARPFAERGFEPAS